MDPERQPTVSARPTDETAISGPDGGGGGDGSSSSSTIRQQKRKAPPKAVENIKAEGGENGSEKGAGTQKRRRRVFSCQSCQRLKCRCEYDPGSQACHRCVTLRIECSLKGEILDLPPHQKPTEAGPSIEERLSHQEKSLSEIKSMVEFVSRQFGLAADIRKPPKPAGGELAAQTPESNQEDGPEVIADPVDLGIKSAPTIVLREISEQVTQGYRRLEHVKLDLVQLQLLDDRVASELVHLFLKHHSHLLLVYDSTDDPSRDIKKLSPFLHSVCCLCAILYRQDLCGTPAHRQIYEQVRMTLGQTLLSSPLTLEDINAVLLMSDHADGPEYIDSWLLTGYCVKQAMLSISFSKIVKNIRGGTSSIQDRRAIHLWSTICLHHLHWSATTGRPSVLHSSYIHQCNILLSFYQASMQDGMLVAEILLYATLHQKLARRTYLDLSGDCDEFRAWKQKWNHLMSLPTASMLRIGYYAANLILAVRALEEKGDAMSPKTFLSNIISFDVSTGDSSDEAEPRASKPSTHILQRHTARYAHSVLETFVDMPAFLMDSIPTYLCLVIGYSALILAHYDESQTKISAAVSLNLISRLEDWCMHTPSKSWAIKFAKLARQRLESRTSGRERFDQRKTSEGEQDRKHLPGWDGTSMPPPTFPVPAEANATATALAETRSYQAGDYGGPSHTDAYQVPHEPLQTGYEVPHPVIPSMEDFFAGGFLDFMRQSRG